MAGTITAANAVIMLAITGLYSAPQQIQGFSAEDIFDVEDQEPAEIVMGVDGRLSAGFVYVPAIWGVTLQADSVSNDLFDNWNRAQKAARDIYFAQGSVLLPSIGKSFTMTRGVLSRYPPLPGAAKTLKPRKFGITWESVSPAAI